MICPYCKKGMKHIQGYYSSQSRIFRVTYNRERFDNMILNSDTIYKCSKCGKIWVSVKVIRDETK